MFRRFVPFFALLVLAGSAPAASAQSLTFGILEVQNGRGRGLVRDGYDRGYGEGVRQGEFDARRGLALNFERDPIFRDGLRGYDRRLGSRDLYRDDFRRGFIDGYRSSYARLRRAPAPPFPQRNGPPSGVFGSQQQRPGGYQEPAYARGYSDGTGRGPTMAGIATGTTLWATATIATPMAGITARTGRATLTATTTARDFARDTRMVIETEPAGAGKPA